MYSDMENEEDFMEFTTSENYKYQISIWCRAYNVSSEKTELFYDFLISLFNLVEETYLGPDVLSYENDQRGHFTWCWDKVVDSFSKEKIFFKPRGVHYEYFWNFFLEAYYFVHMDGDKIKIYDYFFKLFDLKYQKTRSELDMVIEIYKMLEQNLKK
jgi:hypothetical protein